MPALRTTRSRTTILTRASPPTRTGAAIQRANSAGGSTHLRLTVKAPPSKLRQAISGNDLDQDPFTDSPDDTPEPPIRGARSTRNVKTVIDPDSDDEDEELDQDEEDAEGEEMDEDEDEGEDDEEDEEEEEDEDEDAEGDTEMDIHPPPPIIKATPTAAPSNSKGKSKIAVTVSAPNEGPLKSVEAKEAEQDSLSELDDLDEDEDELGDENSDIDDSDEEGGLTRDGTPDMTKLTRRQRAAYENDEANDGSLMALSNEAQKKKHLTAEEHAMRRAEMARRRKNLSEKRNEEEKVLHPIFPQS